MAGNLSVETCGNVFQSSQSSSNYGIGSDGRVGMYVEEANRSWASSSRENDHHAVTIEVANDGGAPNWHVSDVALAKLIDLCVDICQRNNIKALNYTGDKNGNLTRHNMFASTTCPGPYLQGKFSYIAEEVNRRLGAKVAPQVKVLTLGDEGAEVKKLQSNLIKLSYDLGKYGDDGSFGSDTQKAVKKFQGDRGLRKDGVVGPQTYAEIDKALKELTNKKNYSQTQFVEDVQRCLGAGVDGIPGPITLGCTITLSRYKNSKHPVVKYVQKRLYALGYTEVGEADGKFGPATQKAVKNFQRSFSRTSDGEITAKQITWKRLLGM
jgi:peptidoglycan hydrolase-like protein with peptidoglycan-binding domain